MSCNHGNCSEANHEEHEEKVNIYFYGISLLLFALGFLPMLSSIKIVFFLGSVLFAGYDLLIEGIKNIFKLNFEEDTLMAIAVIAAFLLGDFPESCLVVLLFKLGEFLEEKAVEKSRNSIEGIVKIKANLANRINGEKTEIVPVEEIKVGDKIVIKTGEKVPVDAKIIRGDASLDTSPITGESIPRNAKTGDEILSGSINLKGAIECEVLRDEEHSTASQIVDLVYEANNNKGKTEKFITKFSRIYTPIVILLAVLIAVIPWILGYDVTAWIKRALVFLVASCPCSLVISVPLSFFSCVGAISKKGMIVKGTKHIEELAKAKCIAFDKTGTLTTGKMVINQFEIKEGYNREEILEYVNSLESLSNHPIASSIQQLEDNIAIQKVDEYEEIAGHGLIGKIKGKKVVIGNKKLLEKQGIQWENQGLPEEAIMIGVEGKIAGYFILKEEIRPEAKTIVEKLKEQNINKVVMLTGDSQKQAQKIAQELNITEVYAELLPKDKWKVVEERKQKEKVIFVGDGINDSPVLVASDFGIAMGAGTEIAGSTADGILISNNIGSLPTMIKTAKKAMRIIKSNIVFSLIVKLIVLSLGIMGFAPVWLAILADTGVTLLTVLNSLRI